MSAKETRPPPTTVHAEELFGADPRFAPAFSHFLRAAPEAWRTRRVDRFQPVDIDLVEHEVTLQGRINAELLERFLRSDEGKKLALGEWAISAGERLTLLVPAIRQPKRLLLEFSAWDDAGKTPAIMSRYDGARVTAGYILSRLFQGRTRPSPEDLRAPRILLTALMFQNPEDLGARISEWVRREQKPQSAFAPARPLSEDDLGKWIEDEGDLFLNGLGRILRQRLQEVRHNVYGGGPAFELPHDPLHNELQHYSSVGHLLLHAVRDVLKIIIEFADPLPDESHPARLSRRQQFMSDPILLVKEVEAALGSLGDLSDLFSTAPNAVPRDELIFNLTNWMAYVTVPIRLGIPFHLTFSQWEYLDMDYEWPDKLRSWPVMIRSLPDKVVPLERRVKRFFRTSHEYPIGRIFKDASSVHIEITLRDQEIYIPLPDADELPREALGLLARIPGSDAKPQVARLGVFFPTVSHVAGRMLHLYSSRHLGESAREDATLPYVRIFVPIRLITSIFLGYLFTALTFMLAGIYVFYSFFAAAIRDNSPAEVEALVLVTALAASLSIWLTNVQHQRPIINAKLSLARLFFFASLCLFVAGPTAFMIRKILPL